MAVRFGGTIADYAINPNGTIAGDGAFPVFTDAALTVPAVLTNEAGSTIGNTVVARPSGLFVFFAPNGTTVLYVSDGGGGSARLMPDANATYAPINGGGMTVVDL